MKKLLRAALSAATVLALTAALLGSALGASLERTTLNVYQGVNLYVNCAPYLATDLNGKETKPFLYNGTTYVPLRAISTMLGATLDWDNAAKQVKISSLFTATPVNDTIGRTDTALTSATITADKGVEIYVGSEQFVPKNEKGEKVDVYLVDGTTYVPIRALTTLFEVDISYDKSTARVYIGVQPGQVEEEGDQTQEYPYLSKELNDALQKYKDCIELMEPVVGLMWSRQEVYNELNTLSAQCAEQVRLWTLDAAGNPALATALAGYFNALSTLNQQVSELATYINLMATRFTDSSAYIQNIDTNVREYELNNTLLFETCGQMLDTAYQERGKMTEIANQQTIDKFRADIEAAFYAAQQLVNPAAS